MAQRGGKGVEKDREKHGKWQGIGGKKRKSFMDSWSVVGFPNFFSLFVACLAASSKPLPYVPLLSRFFFFEPTKLQLMSGQFAAVE